MGIMRKLITKLFKLKSVILMTIFYASSISIIAQFDHIKWANNYANHSVTSRDNVFDSKMINKESLIITGRTENDFTNFDITTYKINSNIDLLWKQSFSSSEIDISDDHPTDMTIDSSGNVFISGYSFHYPYSASPVLFKCNSNGNLSWSTSFKDFEGSTIEINSFDIEADKSGNCYMLADAHVYGSTTNARTYIFKFDPNGEILWYRKTALYMPDKIIVDNNQDIFVINDRDESQSFKTTIQKYGKNGDLISEHRYYIPTVVFRDAKIDKENNLWTFSDFNYGAIAGHVTYDIIICKFDQEGNLIKQKVYDGQYHDYESVKQVSFYNDSTFLIGIDSYSPESGLDNQFLLINNKLQIIDSLRYGSEWNDNDYIISFDQIDPGKIIVTGISFIDAKNFFPFVYELENFKKIEWLSVPSIAGKTATTPKRVLVDKNGSIFLVGDMEMSVNPECGITHANTFVTKFDPTGKELMTKEFGEDGKSDVIGENVKQDSAGNLYVSGHDQLGPSFVFPFSYFDQDIILNKYSPAGLLEWNRKIILPKIKTEYINHFLTGDSIITVIGSHSGSTNGETILCNFNKTGTATDSALYNKTVKAALTDNEGHFYLFFIEDLNFVILKYDHNLDIVKSYTLSRSGGQEISTFFEQGSVFLLCKDKNYLCKFDAELNPTWRTQLSSFSDYSSSLVTDESGNVFISATKGKGELIKLNSSGIVQWVTKVDNLLASDAGLTRIYNGDIVLFGSEFSVGGCIPNGLALISNDGVLKKYVSTDCGIFRHRTDKNGCIYIFSNQSFGGSKNMYQKYSPNLDLLVTDYFNKSNTFGYTFDFNDILIDSSGDMVIVGSVGYNMDWINGMFSWQVLAIEKINTMNSNPYFTSQPVTSVKLNTDYNYQLTATDPDNDIVHFKIEQAPEWMQLNNSGLLSGKPILSQDTGYYSVKITCFDNLQGKNNQTFILHVAPDILSDINEQQLSKNDFTIYPIPAYKSMNLEFDRNVSECVDIKIINMNGIIVKNYTNLEIGNSGFLNLDINGIVPGYYLLVINENNRTFCKKILIQ
jgi:hypothetical protein